jgi:hypothetical protein
LWVEGLERGERLARSGGKKQRAGKRWGKKRSGARRIMLREGYL